MKLEKLTLDDQHYSKHVWSDMSMLGLTPQDLFCNNSYMWGDQVCAKAEKYGITLGKQYGSKGIAVDKLLAGEPDNTVYCVAIEQLMKFNLQQTIGVFSNYQVIICDLSEGGYRFHEYMKRNGNSMLTAVKGEPVRRTFVATSGMDCLDHYEGISGTLYIPYFLMLTAWEAKNTGNFPKQLNFDQPKKSALVPVHKPRLHRVSMLSWLDKADVLSDSDWSLTIDFEQEGELNDFWKTPNVNIKRFNNLLSNDDAVDFISKYKNQLPKKLVDNDIEHFSQCIVLPAELAGKYNWYVAVETYDYLMFPTEKTFKGFVAGLPVLVCAHSGFGKKLQNWYGFQLPLLERYDQHGISGEDWSRFSAIADIVKENPSTDTAMLEHNHRIMNNTEYHVCLAVEQFVYLIERVQ